MTQERIERIACPKCGTDSTDGSILYVASIDCYRTVLGVKDGRVHVEARYHTGQGRDEGEIPHFECRAFRGPDGACGHRWPVPEAVARDVKWVDDVTLPNAPEAPLPAERSLEEITCPKCGTSVASGLVHLIERVESDRHVVGVRDGKLHVSSLYDTNAEDGGGEDPHFECRCRVDEHHWCDERWPVPEWAKPLILLV